MKSIQPLLILWLTVIELQPQSADLLNKFGIKRKGKRKKTRIYCNFNKYEIYGTKQYTSSSGFLIIISLPLPLLLLPFVFNYFNLHRT